MEYEPKRLPARTALFQRKLLTTLHFGEIIFPLRPESLARPRMFLNRTASSCSQPPLPVNTNAAQKHSSSDKSSPSKIQHNLLPVNTEQKSRNSEAWTAVSDWLATSQAFEKPPAPASITDPTPRHRSCKDYWLQISNSLDLRIKSHSTHSEARIHSNRGSMLANPDINSTISTTHSQTTLPQPIKYTTSDPRPNNTMSPPKKQERERKISLEANISEVREKLEKHKREQERQGQFEAGKQNEADEAVKATANQSKAARSTEADRAVNAQARELASEATATHRERETYVERRAREIHENLLQYKPFDMEAVRREFSEREVHGIKRIVRELGFAKAGTCERTDCSLTG